MVKLPIRNPVIVAKQVTSLGVITGDRFGFGVGTTLARGLHRHRQPLETTRRPDERDDRDHQRFASGEYFEYHGEFYDLDAMKMCPVPEQRVPILIGGHSDMH